MGSWDHGSGLISDNGGSLQSSCLENPMDGGGWWAAVHGVVRSQTRLSDFTFTFHFHALEKEMATHSSVLAWRIPWTVEPGGLPSMGSHRVGRVWSDLAAAAVHAHANDRHEAFAQWLAFHCKNLISSLWNLKKWYKWTCLQNRNRVPGSQK